MKLLAVVFFMLFVTFGQVKGQDVNPRMRLAQILELQNQYREAVLALLEDVKLDYHPDYGYVGLKDLPLNEKGYSDESIPDMFPDRKVISYDSKTVSVTGTVLVAHKAKDGTIFYVLHKLENEPASEINFTYEEEESEMAISSTSSSEKSSVARGYGKGSITILHRCGNGSYYILDQFGNPMWVTERELRRIILLGGNW